MPDILDIDLFFSGPALSAFRHFGRNHNLLHTSLDSRALASEYYRDVVNNSHDAAETQQISPPQETLRYLDKINTRINQMGICVLSKAFTDNVTSEIADFCRQATYQEGHVSAWTNPFKPTLSHADVIKGESENCFSIVKDDLLFHDAVKKVVNNPFCLALAARYLGCIPTLYSVNSFISQVGIKPVGGVQMPHRDYDEVKFISFFVYLDDVISDEYGPFAFQPGSHIKSARCDASKLQPCFGEKGTLVIADTYGHHMGVKPRSRPRNVLWWRYSYGVCPAFVADNRDSPIPRSDGIHANRLDYCSRLMYDLDYYRRIRSYIDSKTDQS